MMKHSIDAPRARRPARWLSLVAALLACGCGSLVSDGAYSYGTLRVTVADTRGQTVPDVQLQLYNRDRPLAYGKTGADGVYDFRFVPFGNVAVRAEVPPGYVLPAGRTPSVDGLTVTRGASTDALIVIERPCCGVVRVRVVDAATGAGIPGANLDFYGVVTRKREAVTGPDGRFEFRDVASDSYGVSVEVPAGYTAVGRNPVDGITVTPGSDATIEIQLRRV